MFDSYYSSLLAAAIALYAISLVLRFFKKSKAGDATLYLGFLLHTGYTLSAGHLPGIFLSLQVFEDPSYMPWAASFIICVNRLRDRSEDAWRLAVIVPLVFAVVALLTPRSMSYFGPNKLTAWATFYFVTEFFSHACFFLGAFLAAMFLAGKAREGSYHRCLVWGFVVYTVSHVVGSIWCFLGWAATFQWVHVHMKAAALWVFYANYLHLRFLPSWNEKKRAWYAVAGAFLLAACRYAI